MKGAMSKGGNQPPKNNTAVNNDINIMCAYSARKNNAKVIAEYSTLYPDTNSDSPSVKSKGGRLVSASADTKNIIAAGNKGIKNHTSDCAVTIVVNRKLPTHNNTDIMISPIETS